MAASGVQATQGRGRGRVPGGRGRAPFINKRSHDRGGPGKGEAGAGRGRGGRRWWPGQHNKAFAGSAQEGHGFALWRKQKVQLDYKKLLRKQKKPTEPKDDVYAERYPEHLKHLYLAEEEKLKNQRRKRQPKEESSRTDEVEGKKSEPDQEPFQADHLQEKTCDPEEVQKRKREPEKQPSQAEILIKKKFKKGKTSYQKTKEEYERVQLERKKKREQAEENKRKKEEAKQLYKKRKMEAYKALSSRTKKGQPNFNVQMEYLLKKIQSKT
ncbi:thyroid transcription factor 1-associated protein 26 [Gastrophryne carolinensis]